MRLALMQFILFGMMLAPYAVVPGPRKTGSLFRAGRRLLLGSPYVLPKDASEEQRLDAQHHLMQFVTGAHFLAPVAAPQTILDVGCGTGIWCRDLTRQFPDARIVGIDYDIERLKRHSRERQIRWQEVDALDALPFICSSFDYVHLRFAATWIPQDRWPEVVAELVRVTRPGGIIELAEGSMPESASDAYTTLCGAFGKVLQERGLDPHAPLLLAERARQAGLERVHEDWFTVGETPEEQHLLFETTYQGFRSLLPLVQKQFPHDDYVDYLAALVEVGTSTPHVTRRDVVVWGRKPTL